MSCRVVFAVLLFGAAAAATAQPRRLKDGDGMFFTRLGEVDLFRFDSQLWRTDGTPDGTRMVQSYYHAGYPSFFVRCGAFVCFQTNASEYGLWRTDGTEAGSTLLKKFSTTFESRPVEMDGRAYFSASDGIHGLELWRTDGTEAGTVLVRDLRPGAASSNLHETVVLDGVLYFIADTGVNGGELWRSDGTPEGTTLVKVVNPARPLYFTRMVVAGNQLFFTLDDLVDHSLWRSDGTADGTVPLLTGGAYLDLASAGGAAYFVHEPMGGGTGVWRSDGTAEGTRAVVEFGSDIRRRPTFLQALGDGVVFAGHTFDGDDETSDLWRTDGTPAGTRLLRSFRSQSLGFWGIMHMASAGTRVYFNGCDADHGCELWATDGTEPGTRLAADIAPGPASSTPNLFQVSGSRVYFGAAGGLWMADASQPLDVPSPVVWTRGAGVTISGNALTKTAVQGWSNAGAVSTHILAAGDGWAEFTASETTTYRMLGLTSGRDTGQSYRELRFALELEPAGIYRVYESGWLKASFSGYQTGDRFRVGVESGSVVYRRNGDVIRTRSGTVEYPLMVDTSLYTPGATITGAHVFGFAPPPPPAPPSGNPITWTNGVGVTIAGSQLTKTADRGWSNAGAVSAEALASGDGWVEFAASETTTYRMLGLSWGPDLGQSYRELKFALELEPGGIFRIYEAGVLKVSFTGYETGDRFRIGVEGGVVVYRRNGELIRTSGGGISYPLTVDTSLYSTGATLADVRVTGFALP